MIFHQHLHGSFANFIEFPTPVAILHQRQRTRAMLGWAARDRTVDVGSQADAPTQKLQLLPDAKWWVSPRKLGNVWNTDTYNIFF